MEPTKEADRVTSEIRGACLRITMHRPEKKNALTLDMYDRLTAALKSAASNDAIRVVVLAGVPGAFTAGNDLGDFMQHPPTDENSPVMVFLKTIASFDKPIIGSVDGAAVGIGTTMLFHCDFVLATERTKFVMPFTKLGLVPEGGSSLVGPAWFGRQRANAWLLLGRPFSAKDALGVGMVNEIVAPEELDRATDALASEIAALPKEAVVLGKRLLTHATREAIAETMKREGVLFAERLRSPETHEAIAAFMMGGKR